MINALKLFVKSLYRKAKGLPTLADIDNLVRELIHSNPSENFIVIGANDGADNDIIKEVINLQKGLGVLVEPQFEVFERLEKKYSARKNLRLVNAAIDLESGTKQIYYLNFSSSRWATGLTSFSKNVIYKHFKNGYIQKCALNEGIKINDNLEQWVSSRNVSTVSMKDLIDSLEISFPKIVFIDTEGHDFNIIKSLDIGRNKPFLIYFEHMHLEKEEYAECIKYLKNFKYKLFFKGRDTLALKVDSWKNLGH